MAEKLALIIVIFSLFALMVLSYRESYPHTEYSGPPRVTVCDNPVWLDTLKHHGTPLIVRIDLDGNMFFDRKGNECKFWIPEEIERRYE